MIQESAKIKKKNIKKLKIVNQQLLNNRIHPMKAKNEDQIKAIFAKKMPVEKNIANGRYKPFMDDSLYHGVNLNPVPVPQQAHQQPPTMTLPKYYDNYCFYLQELQQLNLNYYYNNQQHLNNSFIYQQQLNESIRRKGYKFTLADIEGKEDPNYFNGQYLSDEGYLV